MQDLIREQLKAALGEGVATAADLAIPDVAAHGHYATSIALKLAKERKQPPVKVAEELAEKLRTGAVKNFFAKVEVAPPGFVNMWLTDDVLNTQFAAMAKDAQRGVPQQMAGKTVMVEFTDPNPFKLFHIGHLMSNAIGESFSRLYEAVGAKVFRANYQGDVGPQIAKSVWGMLHADLEAPAETASNTERVAYLNKCYVAGAAAYVLPENAETAKKEIDSINTQIYDRSEAKVNEFYDRGRKWSLDYLEEMYALLGTKFDQYFFESEIAEEGKQLVLAHPEVFPESQGARVFKGEEHGLHTRVFINSRGLPTYEAKELGLNKKKFELYPLDLSVIVTGNEITDYFRVLMKAFELLLPDVAKRTRHSPHGMMLGPDGKKLSSRTGKAPTADSLIVQTKEHLVARDAERAKTGDPEEKAASAEADQEASREVVAIGAIKYSILKQRPGQDIVFNFDKLLSLHGDSGPYLQYTYARLQSILRKADEAGLAYDAKQVDGIPLSAEEERAVIRKMVAFPDAVVAAATSLTPNTLATYLYEFAALANRFYEGAPIMKEEDAIKRTARLALAASAAGVLERGLYFLGIKVPERM